MTYDRVGGLGSDGQWVKFTLNKDSQPEDKTTEALVTNGGKVYRAPASSNIGSLL